jgi:hypothetical protein
MRPYLLAELLCDMDRCKGFGIEPDPWPGSGAQAAMADSIDLKMLTTRPDCWVG